MRRAILIACIVLVAAALVGAVIVMSYYLYGPGGNAIHMRNVTRRLAEWQARYD